MQEIASKRYAHALYELGVETKKLDQFLEELEMVSNAYRDSKELQTFLGHPTISIEEKTLLIKNVFKANIDEEILRIVILLVENSRVNEIVLVYKNYKKLVEEYKGIKVAYATTAVKMTSDEIKALEKKLSDKYKLTVIVENLIDESIIGGVYLKIDDEVIDGTIKGSLENIQKEVMKQGGEVRA